MGIPIDFVLGNFLQLVSEVLNFVFDLLEESNFLPLLVLLLFRQNRLDFLVFLFYQDHDFFFEEAISILHELDFHIEEGGLETSYIILDLLDIVPPIAMHLFIFDSLDAVLVFALELIDSVHALLFGFVLPLFQFFL